MHPDRIIPLNRLLLRCIGGRWHLGIALAGRRIVTTTDRHGRPIANLLPLASRSESDQWQTQLAAIQDDDVHLPEKTP